MTQNIERRGDSRLDLETPLSCRVRTEDGTLHKVEIVNISRGGLMLSSEMPIVSVGQNLQIEIKLGDQPLFEAQAKVTGGDPLEIELFEDDLEKSEVRWVSGAGGQFGVSFVNLRPEKQLALLSLIDNLASR